MHSKPRFFIALVSTITVFNLAWLVACSGQGSNSPAKAAQAYLSALVEKNANTLSNLSCADWEPQAILEMDSLAAVKVSLKGVNCQENKAEGGFTLVSCTGAIIADYNGEILEIQLSERIFKMANEKGEWRMCGYK